MNDGAVVLYRVVVSFACLVSAIPAIAEAKDFAQSKPQLEIGRGFDTATGEARGRCLKNIKTTVDSSAQSATLSLDKIDSVSSMLSLLRISASARFGSGSWSGFAESQYLKTKSYNSKNSYFYVRVLVENAPTSVDSAELTDDAKAELAKGKSAFHAKCGDSFVSSSTTGGEFTAIYRYSAQTEQEASSFSAAIGGRFVNLLTSASANAEVESALKQFQSSDRLKIDIIRNGDVGILPKLSPEALTEFALQFPEKVRARKGTPSSISFSVGSYAELGFSVRPTGLDVDAVLVRLIDVLDRDVENYDDVRAVLDHPADYRFANRAVTLAKLKEDQNSLQTEIDRVRSFAKKSCLAERERTQTVADPCNFASIPNVVRVDIPPRASLVGGCSVWSDTNQCLRCEYTASQLAVGRIGPGGTSAPAVCANMPPGSTVTLKISGNSWCADKNQYGNSCGEPGVDWYVDVMLSGALDSALTKPVNSPVQVKRGLIHNSHQVDVTAEGVTPDGFVSAALSVTNIQMWPSYATGLSLDPALKFEIAVKDRSKFKLAEGYK